MIALFATRWLPILIGTTIGVALWFAEAALVTRFTKVPLTTRRLLIAGATGGAVGAGVASIPFVAAPHGGLWPLFFAGVILGAMVGTLCGWVVAQIRGDSVAPVA